MQRRLLFLLLFLPISLAIHGQCMTVRDSLVNLIPASSLVVEGKVRSQQSFWDSQRKNIYTVNQVEVFKAFQGLPSLGGTINVVTRGGVVGLEGEDAGELAMDRVSNALELQVGEMGLFLLQSFPIDLSLGGVLPLTETLYRPTEGVLGFIRYDLVIGEAQGVFENYSDITDVLYGQVTSITGMVRDIGLWDDEDTQLRGETSVERSIISEEGSGSNSGFEVHAGVGNILTITGTDFGDEPGSVLFPDANSGGSRYISALANQIQSWSANQIVLEVPYRAGTGPIRIDKANDESLIGEEALPIGYDHINVQFSDASGRRSYETQLTSDNGAGGYDFQFESGFAANVGASQAFTSLINTWACTTGVNFQIGEVTEVDEDASDGINIVRFDNGAELGGRTLAYARSRYRGCYQGETIKWFVNEIEVVVNDDYDWYYGEGTIGSNQFDFETVMLHEIGHTQQLGHVINEDEVMHFAVGPGQQKRALSHIDTLGGIFVTDKSAEEAVCGRDLMERYTDCCEQMMVAEQPADQVLCSNDFTAQFQFQVDASDSWQWQIKEGNDWIDLANDEVYAGTNTYLLTVTRPENSPTSPMGQFEEPIELRCVASNACEETEISDIARLTLRSIEITMNLSPASCESEGEIQFSRKRMEGNLRISTDGGTTFETVWPQADYEFNHAIAPGIYDISVMDVDTGCAVALGTVIIDEPVVLELAANVITNTDCAGLGGQMQVDFNDHPNFESVLLSLDGGMNYQEYSDALGTAIFNNLDEGEYQVKGMWPDGTCLTAADSEFIGSETCPDNGDTEDNNPDQENTDDVPETGGDTPDAGDDEPTTEDEPDSGDGPQMESEPQTGDEGPAMGEETEVDNTPDNDDAFESVATVITMYPNPATDRIYIRSDQVVTGFQLFNTRGTLVQRAVPILGRENTVYFDLEYPQSGVYILSIITEDGTIIKRILVK